MLRLLFDLDAIIINLYDSWLYWYNARWNDNITIADLRSYDMHENVKCGHKVYEFFKDHYRICQPLPGAHEALRQFFDAGHDVLVMTASAKGGTKIKLELVQKAFRRFPKSNLLVGERKELIQADLFVDDKPETIRAYKKAWPTSKVATIAYPYNETERSTVDLYAEGFLDTSSAWRQIRKLVSDLEKTDNAHQELDL